MTQYNDLIEELQTKQKMNSGNKNAVLKSVT